MEQNYSSEANGHLSSQEITHLICNPKVHYRVLRNPSLAPILSQMYPVHTFPPYFPNIILVTLHNSCKFYFLFFLSCNKNVNNLKQRAEYFCLIFVLNVTTLSHHTSYCQFHLRGRWQHSTRVTIRVQPIELSCCICR